MKIAFIRPYMAVNFTTAPILFAQPTPTFVGYTRAELIDVNRITGLNVGNLIHAEAPSRIFEFDAEGSAVFNLARTASLRSIKWLAHKVNANFDAVIFSTANFIREETVFDTELAFFSHLKIPFYLFGAGVQTEALARHDNLKPALKRFLEIVDSDARLFATRGHRTSSILGDMGYKRSVPLGCPSFFAYPGSILRIRAPEKTAVSKVITAGRLAASHGPGKRYLALNEAFQTFPEKIKIEYVFQNEIFWTEFEGDSENYFDPTCMKIDSRWARRRFCQPRLDSLLRIDGFRYFPDTASWRMFASTADMYFGDRIHGGVVCMQAGIPALVVYNDLRVQELTEHIAIPSIAHADLAGKNFDGLLDEYMNEEAITRMKLSYRNAAGEFFRKSSSAGLIVRQSNLLSLKET
jgi:hypothetical protein